MDNTDSIPYEPQKDCKKIFIHKQANNNCTALESDNEWLYKGFPRAPFTIQQGGKETVCKEFSKGTQMYNEYAY